MSKTLMSWRIVIVAVLACLIPVAPVFAQLNTQHLKGSNGLKAGSQAPPGLYFIAPLLYSYNTDEVKDRNGNSLPTNASLTTWVFAGGASVVTKKKLLGGNYGALVLFPVGANNRIEGTLIDTNPGAGLSDSVFQPISLGWHFTRADALVAYNIFAPTGRYTPGATNNTGFGMWGNEIAVGTTVYLTASKKYHASTIASFDFQTTKEDTDTKVGNTMILEGGGGVDFLKGGLVTGLVYYSAIKLTDDRFSSGFVNNLPIGKNRDFALGPEVQLALAKGDTVYGFLKVNYQWELYARTTTQGTALNVMATFPLKPIKIPH